jgi:hypothetical protein
LNRIAQNGRRCSAAAKDEFINYIKFPYMAEWDINTNGRCFTTRRFFVPPRSIQVISTKVWSFHFMPVIFFLCLIYSSALDSLFVLLPDPFVLHLQDSKRSTEMLSAEDR